MKPLRVLVLCSGNIGRSPLAARLLEHALAEDLGVEVSELAEAGVVVSSAGADAPAGHPASKRGIAFAVEHDVDLSDHSATRLTRELLDQADLIYGMDPGHFVDVATLNPEALSQMILWEGEGSDLPDPHHESDEFFRSVALRIEAAVPDRVDDVLAMLAARSTP